MNREVMGKRLRELRGNLPVETVASSVGVSRSALMMYERGERTPRDKVKVNLAKFYGKSVEFIFFSQ